MLLVCRGLLTGYEKPTMNSNYEFIVATPAIFNPSGEHERRITPAHDQASFSLLSNVSLNQQSQLILCTWRNSGRIGEDG